MLRSSRTVSDFLVNKSWMTVHVDYICGGFFQVPWGSRYHVWPDWERLGVRQVSGERNHVPRVYTPPLHRRGPPAGNQGGELPPKYHYPTCIVVLFNDEKILNLAQSNFQNFESPPKKVQPSGLLKEMNISKFEI